MINMLYKSIKFFQFLKTKCYSRFGPEKNTTFCLNLLETWRNIHIMSINYYLDSRSNTSMILNIFASYKAKINTFDWPYNNKHL